MLGTSDAWATSRLSHRPNEPSSYYIEDCRISKSEHFLVFLFMLYAANRAALVPRPCRARAVPVPRPCRARSLTNFNRCLRLPYPPQFWRQRKSQMSRHRVSLTWGSKKNLIKKKNLLLNKKIVNTNYFLCVRGLWNYLIIIMRNYFPPKRR